MNDDSHLDSCKHAQSYTVWADLVTRPVIFCIHQSIGIISRTFGYDACTGYSPIILGIITMDFGYLYSSLRKKSNRNYLKLFVLCDLVAVFLLVNPSLRAQWVSFLENSYIDVNNTFLLLFIYRFCTHCYELFVRNIFDGYLRMRTRRRAFCLDPFLSFLRRLFALFKKYHLILLLFFRLDFVLSMCSYII